MAKKFKRKQRLGKKSNIKTKRYLYSAEFPDKSVYFGKTHFFDINKLASVYNNTTNTYSIRTGLTPVYSIITTLKNDNRLNIIKNHLIEVFNENNYKILNSKKKRK